MSARPGIAHAVAAGPGSPAAAQTGRDTPGSAASCEVAAVLLAAGRGARMGGRPKGLLERDGVPLVRRLLDALAGAGIAERVVVLGHHRDAIRAALAGARARLVEQPDPRAEQVASLRAGLRALAGHADAVLVALADQPLVGVAEIAALLAAWRARPPGCEVLVPTRDGQPGNPVVFSAAVRAAILAGDDGFGCRQWQARHPQAVHRWDPGHGRHQVDVDTPADLDALAATTGVRLRWPDGPASDERTPCAPRPGDPNADS